MVTFFLIKNHSFFLKKKMISRSKVENIVCLALNGINIVFYLLIITAVIFKCIQGNFADIVMGIYGMYVFQFQEFLI